MTRDEIVTALRCCDGGEYDECNKCPLRDGINCRNLLDLALRDTVLRRDAQIVKLAADRKAMRNELCQYCGKYKYAHKGACDGCKWREM